MKFAPLSDGVTLSLSKRDAHANAGEAPALRARENAGDPDLLHLAPVRLRQGFGGTLSLARERERGARDPR